MKSIRTHARFLLPLLIFAVILLFFMRGLHLDPRHLPSALLNKPLPRLDLPSLENPAIRLDNKKFLGHISLLHVWATWCVTCQDEQPYLMGLARVNHIRMYAIDYKDDSNAARQWLQQFGNPYQLVGIDANGKAGIDLGVYGTPETFVINRHGIIRYKIIGALTPEIWRDEVAPLINTMG